MYSLIPDHLGFLLKREEAKHEVDSKLASHCAALARHTVHVQPRTEATEKQERKEKKKKKESERDDVKIWSVLFRAVKHCLMFNGAVCVCQSFYNQISQEKETNADTFLILNFIFFFYYCVGLLILLFSGPSFKPPAAKSFELVRLRAKTEEKVILTDIRFRIRTKATEADIKRVGNVTRKNYEGREAPPTNCLKGKVMSRSFLCAPFSEGELVK